MWKKNDGFLLVDALISIFIIFVCLMCLTGTLSSHANTKQVIHDRIERMKEENDTQYKQLQGCEICQESPDSSS